MSLQGLDIIQYYNRLNGNSISIEKLKAFRKRVESHIESTGTGPHMTDLKGILARVSKAIKSMIDAGADIAERVELVPIDITKTTGKVLRVASGYEEKAESPKQKAESSSTGNVKEISIASIHTDTKRFQNRTDAFNIEPKKKHRGPLNPLQMAQLQDAIKAGRTPKVNLKAKLNAKEKPAPLFDQPVNDPRQASLFGAKKAKGVSASSLAGMEFKTLPFAGRWKDHIGTPSENFSAMVWGKPKQGKTHYSFQFANYLSQFGPVLYVLSDEGIGYTVKEKIIANGLDKNDKVHFIETRQVSEVENAIKSGNYKFIFIDLISNLRNGDEPLKADGFYQLRKRYPQVSFIPVFSSTKNGNFRGDQDWAHDVDVLVDVEAGKAVAQGRFGGGEYEIFKKAKSKAK